MLLSMLEKRVDELVGDLACYQGHRTLWLDQDQGIVHAEPDDMLDELGFAYIYIATVFQPNRDQLTAALLRSVPVELDRVAASAAPVRPARLAAPATARRLTQQASTAALTSS